VQKRKIFDSDSEASMRNFKINLKHLYNTTLYESQEIRPWGCDETGCFVGLRYRYEFVELLIRNDFTLPLDMIQQTSYWDILNAPIHATPREGGKDWIYQDPLKQVYRFIVLVNYFKRHGYITSKHSKTLDEFEHRTHQHEEKSHKGEVKTVSYVGREYAGIIGVKRLKNGYTAWNGHHRLAILMCFYDNNLFKEDKILVRCVDAKEENDGSGFSLRSWIRRLYRCLLALKKRI